MAGAALSTDATSPPAAVSTGGGNAPSSSAPNALNTVASSVAGIQRVEGIAAMLFVGLFLALCDVF